MKKIEIKHLAPYLPYGLKVHHSTLGPHEISGYRTTQHGISILANDTHIGFIEELKPILRPLSDLTKTFNNNRSYLNHLQIAYGIELDHQLDYDIHEFSEKIGRASCRERV